VFLTPTRAALEAAEAPRRVPKAGYCRLRPTSDLPDSSGRITPLAGFVEPPPAAGAVLVADEKGEIVERQAVSDLLAGVEMARAALRAAPVPPRWPRE
jgi:hypothetical protein